MEYNYKPENVCPMNIKFDLEGDIVKDIEFTGGCNGNLKAVSKLVDGKSVEEIENLFSDITCGRRSTSCSNQLAVAVRKAFEEQNA